MRLPSSRLLALLLALVAAPAAADVVSTGPQALSVTVYRDDAIRDPAAPAWNGLGLGMITETRTVTLPAGEARLVFEGVADGIIAPTVSLTGFPGTVAEQNFDYELLSPGTLIEHSIGLPVKVARTNPRTGKRTIETAVLRSGPNGVVLDFGGRVEALGCSGDPEGLVFDRVPAGLTGKPTLSIKVRAARAGTYRVKLAYLTTGLAWKAAYVAQLAPGSGRLDLTGWITLANHGDVGYPQAQTSVVAGRLARNALRLAARYVVQRQLACWPMGDSHHPRGITPYLAQPEEDETGARAPQSVALRLYAPPPSPPPAVMAMAKPRAQQSALGDYKLYTLDEPATVAARQTKQVAFLDQPGVAFETVQVYRAPPRPARNGALMAWPTTTTFRFENTAAKGLGRALPAGSVAFMAPAGGSDLFLGAHDLRDVPAGEPFELEVGRSRDVTVRDVMLSVAVNGKTGMTITREMTAANAGAKSATVEIRQPQTGRGFEVVSESAAHGLKSDDPVWRLAVAPGQTATLTYAFTTQR